MLTIGPTVDVPRFIRDIHGSRGQAAGRGMKDELSTDPSHSAPIVLSNGDKLFFYKPYMCLPLDTSSATI